MDVALMESDRDRDHLRDRWPGYSCIVDIENRNADVDEFLDSIEHSRKAEVTKVRMAILAAEPEITETIKWNAPNFRYAGEDRVTFRLQPGDQVQIVFHRGVRVRDDHDTFTVSDPAGLLVWRSPDRAVATLANADETDTRLVALTELVGRWIRA